MKRHVRLFLVPCIAFSLAGCSSPKKVAPMTSLQPKINRFAPTVITADTSTLSEGNRKALHILVRAMKLLDRLYLRQVWSGNEELLKKLQADDSPQGHESREYFMINMGPWSNLDHDEPFIGGVPTKKPEGANYYPERMKKDEFLLWLSTLPESEKVKATGFYYAIRADQNGTLTTTPYSEEYRDILIPLSKLLHEAAAVTDNRSLRTYLDKRADAFLSNNYYDSDIAWMQLDSPIDPTIGPYEVYLDKLFNYKAAFEGFVTIRNDSETVKLARFSGYLQEIEDHLPIMSRYRNVKLGTMAPIRVVDEVAIGGESRAGVQTAAFNLPNDERVIRETGSKRVMLRNVQEAKFRKVLLPIAGLAVDPIQQSAIKFEPFFTHILAHELMHGLGPHDITVQGRKTTVRQQMKELGSALEEAKADVAGLFALQYLINKGILPKTMEEQMYSTFLAGIFRSLRFGSEDAHGRGMALQCNYMWDEGGIQYNETIGTFKVNVEKMKDAVKKLTGEIMTIQAEGSYEKAKALLDRFASIRPPMQRTIEKLSSIPVDINPQFPLAGDTDETSKE
jgi:hypothetical protein